MQGIAGDTTTVDPLQSVPWATHARFVFFELFRTDQADIRATIPKRFEPRRSSNDLQNNGHAQRGRRTPPLSARCQQLRSLQPGPFGHQREDVRPRAMDTHAMASERRGHRRSARAVTCPRCPPTHSAGSRPPRFTPQSRATARTWVTVQNRMVWNGTFTSQACWRDCILRRKRLRSARRIANARGTLV